MNDYKFIAYSQTILQKFAVNYEVMVMIRFERPLPQTVRKLHAQHTGSYRVLRKISSIAYELDIP